ncbi:hypothetical protein N9N08_00810 [bacterium]|jgi:hypothetical protein|nr:hypothetical protein [bacterium]
MASYTNIELYTKIVQGLLSKGITPVIDGPSVILVDKSGTKMVDFSNGLGPIGTNLTILSQAEEASSVVRRLIKVKISDFQFIALVSLAMHIGSKNFAKSTVVRELNKEMYDRIPGLIQRWRKGPINENTPPQYKKEYADRRNFEAELFTTPDWVNFDYKPSEGSSLTWAQLTAKLRKYKKEAFEEMQTKEFLNDGPDVIGRPVDPLMPLPNFEN